MKRSLALIFLCLIILSGLIHSQSAFGGLRLEGNYLSTNNLPHYQPAINCEPALGPGLKFGGNLSLEKKRTEDSAAKSVPGLNIFLGLGLEGDFMAGKNRPYNQSPYMVGPTLQLGLKIKNDFTFETRWGLLISDQVTGGQLGIYVKKNIFHDFLYAVGGINFYDNSENPKGNLFIEDSYRGPHTLLGGGIGIHSPDDAFLELQYFKTLDEKFGDTSYWDGNMKHTRYWTVNGFVKMSLGYNFSLISKRSKE